MTKTLPFIAAALASASFLGSGTLAAQTLGGGAPRDAGRGESAARSSMPPDTVLAQRGDLKVTRADYDVELLRLPPDIRGGFATSEKRVADLLTRMLLTKELAALADSTGQMSDPVNAARLASEVERYKAQVMILHYEMEAAARFDADRSKWEIRARDVYLAEGKRFDTPEMRTLARLTIRVGPRGGAEPAMQAAQALRKRWVAGEDYAKLAVARACRVGCGPGSGGHRHRCQRPAHLLLSIDVMVMAPLTRSASNLTLSPALTLSSMAGSATRNTMVIASMSRLLMGPCLSVTFPADLSTLMTSACTMPLSAHADTENAIASSIAVTIFLNI